METVEEVKKLLSSLKQHFQCTICLDFLSQPVSTKCNHQFCSDCVQELIKSNKKSKKGCCPLCKSNLTKRSLNHNPKLSKVISAVKDVCNAADEDCSNLGISPLLSQRHKKISPSKQNLVNTKFTRKSLDFVNKTSKDVSEIQPVKLKEVKVLERSEFNNDKDKRKEMDRSPEFGLRKKSSLNIFSDQNNFKRRKVSADTSAECLEVHDEDVIASVSSETSSPPQLPFYNEAYLIDSDKKHGEHFPQQSFECLNSKDCINKNVKILKTSFLQDSTESFKTPSPKDVTQVHFICSENLEIPKMPSMIKSSNNLTKEHSPVQYENFLTDEDATEDAASHQSTQHSCKQESTFQSSFVNLPPNKASMKDEIQDNKSAESKPNLLISSDSRFFTDDSLANELISSLENQLTRAEEKQHHSKSALKVEVKLNEPNISNNLDNKNVASNSSKKSLFSKDSFLDIEFGLARHFCKEDGCYCSNSSKSNEVTDSENINTFQSSLVDNLRSLLLKIESPNKDKILLGNRSFTKVDLSKRKKWYPLKLPEKMEGSSIVDKSCSENSSMKDNALVENNMHDDDNLLDDCDKETGEVVSLLSQDLGTKIHPITKDFTQENLFKTNNSTQESCLSGGELFLRKRKRKKRSKVHMKENVRPAITDISYTNEKSFLKNESFSDKYLKNKNEDSSFQKELARQSICSEELIPPTPPLRQQHKSELTKQTLTIISEKAAQEVELIDIESPDKKKVSKTSDEQMSSYLSQVNIELSIDEIKNKSLDSKLSARLKNELSDSGLSIKQNNKSPDKLSIHLKEKSPDNRLPLKNKSSSNKLPNELKNEIPDSKLLIKLKNVSPDNNLPMKLKNVSPDNNLPIKLKNIPSDNNFPMKLKSVSPDSNLNQQSSKLNQQSFEYKLPIELENELSVNQIPIKLEHEPSNKNMAIKSKIHQLYKNNSLKEIKESSSNKSSYNTMFVQVVENNSNFHAPTTENFLINEDMFCSDDIDIYTNENKNACIYPSKIKAENDGCLERIYSTNRFLSCSKEVSKNDKEAVNLLEQQFEDMHSPDEDIDKIDFHISERISQKGVVCKSVASEVGIKETIDLLAFNIDKSPIRNDCLKSETESILVSKDKSELPKECPKINKLKKGSSKKDLMSSIEELLDDSDDAKINENQSLHKKVNFSENQSLFEKKKLLSEKKRAKRDKQRLKKKKLLKKLKTIFSKIVETSSSSTSSEEDTSSEENEISLGRKHLNKKPTLVHLEEKNSPSPPKSPPRELNHTKFSYIEDLKQKLLAKPDDDLNEQKDAISSSPDDKSSKEVINTFKDNKSFCHTSEKSLSEKKQLVTPSIKTFTKKNKEIKTAVGNSSTECQSDFYNSLKKDVKANVDKSEGNKVTLKLDTSMKALVAEKYLETNPTGCMSDKKEFFDTTFVQEENNMKYVNHKIKDLSPNTPIRNIIKPVNQSTAVRESALERTSKKDYMNLTPKRNSTTLILPHPEDFDEKQACVSHNNSTLPFVRKTPNSTNSENTLVDTLHSNQPALPAELSKSTTIYNKKAEEFKTPGIPVIMISRLNKKQTHFCDMLCQKLKAKMAENVSDNVTHLVIGTDKVNFLFKSSYTFKYLMALVSGIWIVSFQWVIQCLKSAQFVEEGPFEVKGDPNEGHEDIPLQFRLNIKKQKNLLLTGYCVWVHGTFQRSPMKKDQLVMLLKKLDAHVVFSLNDDESFSSYKKLTMLTDNLSEISTHENDLMNKYRLQPVHPEWLVHSVINFRVVNEDDWIVQIEE